MKRLGLSVVALLAVACGARDALDDQRYQARCEPTTQVSCICDDRSWGNQVCTPQGTWGACACGGSGGDGGGSDAGVDAPAPLPVTLQDPSRCLKGGSRFYGYSEFEVVKEHEAIGIELPPVVYPRYAVDMYMNNNIQVSFTTAAIGKPIQVGQYDKAECGIPTYQKAGFTLHAGAWLYCTAGSQTIVVHEIVWDGSTLDRLTLAFEMVTKAGKTVGCLHYER